MGGHWTLDDLRGRPLAKLNPDLFPTDPVDRPARKADFAGLAGDSDERALQARCETLLEAQGYLRLTAKNADRPARGWFGHLNKPIGNPLMPDLFVFHEPNDRPALLVELKVRDEFQPGQWPMICRSQWVVCVSFEEFRSVLTGWADMKGAT